VTSADSSTSWMNSPMLAFDLESTGVQPDHDRVATACAAVVCQGVVGHQRDWTVAIDVDMPAQASAVNKLTTEYLRANGRPAAEVIPHEAAADAIAATRVVYKLAQRHKRIAAMDLETLHAAQVVWRSEQCDELRAYFDKVRKPHDGVPGAWPLIPLAEASQQGALL
jgi:hypothetical protein